MRTSTRLFYATYNYAAVQDEEWVAPKAQRRSAKSAKGTAWRSSSSSSNSRRGSNSNKHKTASSTSQSALSDDDEVHMLFIVTFSSMSAHGIIGTFGAVIA
jgi:hypothetical protein